MERLIITNVFVYKSIAEDAYIQAVETEKKSRTTRLDNSGYVLRYDPEHTSFKSSIITVVFAGMWLEALTHLLIVRGHGEKKYREYDRKSYEDKLRLLGVEDEELLLLVGQLRATRRELIHEKAHFDIRTIKIAQKEAELAIKVIRKIEAELA